MTRGVILHPATVLSVMALIGCLLGHTGFQTETIGHLNVTSETWLQFLMIFNVVAKEVEKLTNQIHQSI